MTWDNVQQFIRIVGYMLGSGLVSAGVLTEGVLETAIGGVITLASVGWWLWWNRGRAPGGPEPVETRGMFRSPAAAGALVVAAALLAACAGGWAEIEVELTPERCAALEASEAPLVCRPAPAAAPAG